MNGIDRETYMPDCCQAKVLSTVLKQQVQLLILRLGDGSLFTKFLTRKLQISVNHNNPCRLQRKWTLVMFSDQNASMAVLLSLCFTLQRNGFSPSLPTSVFHSSPLTSPPPPPHRPTSCFLIQCNSVSALVSLPLPSLYLSPLCCHLMWQAYSQSNESKPPPPHCTCYTPCYLSSVSVWVQWCGDLSAPSAIFNDSVAHNPRTRPEYELQAHVLSQVLHTEN